MSFFTRPVALASAVAVALAVATALILGPGCQMAVDLDGLHDQKCAPAEKSCGGRCVSRADPAASCGLPSCAPCALPHATAKCDNGECVISVCTAGYADCNDRDPGCETDLAHDPDHCGACRPLKVCVTAHGTPGCSDQQCAVGGCNDGWRDCNREVADGCERDIWQDTDCGACGNACPAGTACERGVCL